MARRGELDGKLLDGRNRREGAQRIERFSGCVGGERERVEE